MNVRLTIAAAAATVLASIALYPLLDGGTWFWAGVGAVIVVAAIGAATRRRAIPAILCFAATIAGEALYLNIVFARRQSWAGLVPTGASLHHLRALVAQATAETSKYAPPVPDRPGIVLLAAAGIGLVAALTDVLAVRLHRPAIAGLPLLVLFCVPLTTDARPGVVGGTLVFCAGVIGYLGLLSADGRHRLRLWGRLVHPWHDVENVGPDIRPLTAAGRRIGSAAVVLALSLPLLVPGLRQHRLFPGTGGGGPGGYHGQISFPKPLDALNAELHERHPQTILTYHTKDNQPPYLQVYVLDKLDPSDNEWTLTPPSDPGTLKNGTMPNAPGLLPKTNSLPVTEQIDLGSNLANSASVSYLPLPFPAQRVKVGGTWRVDPDSLTVLGTNIHLANLRYQVTARDLNPSPQFLREAGPATGLAQDEQVPKQYRDLLSLARNLTAHRTSAYAMAVAIQKWFTRPGNFTYSLNVPSGNGPGALKQFLLHSRTGYCQQFAFGMAVLARLVHIPARVVIGYTQGTIVGTDTWQVKTSDAHAWPELFFPGAGWLRFEPTPPNSAGEPGQATAFTPPYSNPQDYVGVTSSPTTGLQTQINPNPVKTPGHSTKGFIGKLKGATGGAGSGGAAKKHTTAPYAELAIGLLAVLLIAPGLTRFVSRRWRWWKARDDAARAHVAWRELRDDLIDHRIPSPVSESPRTLARRLTQSLGLAGAERDALERVARAEERASYASSPADSAQLRSDAALVRRAVARGAGLRARWSARVVPTSALVPARAALQHLLDVFGWMELAATKARHRTLLRREKAAQT
jgi:transglutaminase-like putative cysteine protease